MRTFLIGSLVLGAALLSACDEKTEAPAATPMPSASAAPSSATSTTAAPPKAPEGPKDHASRAKAMAEAFAAHDSKKFAALYAENAVVKTVGIPDVKGRAAIEKDAERMFAVFKDAKITTGRVWAKDKHTAVIESVFTGTNTGDAPEMGLPKATNKMMGVAGASWMEVGEDGFIKEERRYHDMPTGLGQLQPDPKNPVRAVMTEPPAGTKEVEAKMTPDEGKNLEYASKLVAAMNSGKIDDIMKLADKDVVDEDYTAAATLKGEKAVKEHIEKYLKAFPDMKASMPHSFAAGEFAIMEFDYTGTNKGPLGPIKATNKPVDVHELEVDEIKDGKLVHSWAWGNSAEMLGELGLIPPPGGAAPAAPAGGKPPPAAK